MIQLELFSDLFWEEDKVTLDELYFQAGEFCREHWNVPFTGRIEIVKTKWRWQLGCFIPALETICFSEWRNRERWRFQVYDTLLHELVHWRLFKTGRPYRDTDPEFVRECLRVGAKLSGAKAAQGAAKKVLEEEEKNQWNG